MQCANRLMKQALLWETKCPLTLDPLTIFSFLVVHSRLTWNRNYCKCISLTQEKNKVTMSIFSKSSGAQTPQDSSVRAENPPAASAPAAPGQAVRAVPALRWPRTGAEERLHSPRRECWSLLKRQLPCTLLHFPDVSFGLNWQCWCHYAGMDWCSYSDILLLRSWVRRFNCICQLQ